jgi:hypothetical protein
MVERIWDAFSTYHAKITTRELANMLVEPLAVLDGLKKISEMFKIAKDTIGELDSNQKQTVSRFVHDVVENCQEIVSNYYKLLADLEDGLADDKPRAKQLMAIVRFRNGLQEFFLLRREMFSQMSFLHEQDIPVEFKKICESVIDIIDFGEDRLSVTKGKLPIIPTTAGTRMFEGLISAYPELDAVSGIFGGEFYTHERDLIIKRIFVARKWFEERWIKFVQSVAEFDFEFSNSRYILVSISQ